MQIKNRNFKMDFFSPFGFSFKRNLPKNPRNCLVFLKRIHGLNNWMSEFPAEHKTLIVKQKTMKLDVEIFTYLLYLNYEVTVFW